MTTGQALYTMNYFIRHLDPRTAKQVRRLRRKLVKKWLSEDDSSRWWIAIEMRR
ncbi:hypothetical protein U7537_04715 [Lacticaseibacillus rhamnosus]